LAEKKRKLDELIRKRHEVPNNAVLHKSGADIQPRLLGMVVFSDLRLGLHMDDLDKELAARNLAGHHKTFTDKKALLLQHERLLWQQSHPNEDQKNFDPKFFKVLCGEALFRVGEEVLD